MARLRPRHFLSFSEYFPKSYFPKITVLEKWELAAM
jgi:hypothetical protein